MKKMEFENLPEKETIIFSIYGYFIVACFLLLIVSYNFFEKNTILMFFDIIFSILNVVIGILLFKNIFYLKHKFEKENVTFEYKTKPTDIIISFLFIMFILFTGVFLLVYFKEKSIYIFTAYSVGISFILYPLIILYASVKNWKKGKK